jgi:aspartyl-tRNA(Asn)/glutamyl-tRNA(Gln) amidotransferase subunit B
VVIPPALLEELRGELPELPLARRQRFISQYGLSAYDAAVLTSERELADYFEAMVTAGADAKAASNWVMGEVLREMSDRGMSIAEFPVPAEDTAELLGLLQKKAVQKRAVTYRTAREVFAKMIDGHLSLADFVPSGEDATTTTPPPTTTTAPWEIIQEEGLAQISDTGELERAVARVIAENPKPVADFRAGRKQAFAYLVGQLMRVTKGKANPQLASQLLEQALAQEK